MANETIEQPHPDLETCSYMAYMAGVLAVGSDFLDSLSVLMYKTMVLNQYIWKNLKLDQIYEP